MEADSSTAPQGNIFLIGPMGCGKTAVGKTVARLLHLPFYDSDSEVERRTGAAISLIFDREGEAGFRRREAEIIDELTGLKGIVLATGGGAVLDPRSRQRLAERGWVAFLETSVEQQAARTAQTRHRPMLQGFDPLQRLRSLYEIREPLYETIADFKVSTDNRHVKAVAHRIVEAARQAHVVTGQIPPQEAPSP